MASDIRIRVGGGSATYIFAATDQQVAAALTRFARNLGIPITGVANDDLLAILTHEVDDMKRRSKAQQIADADAISHATNAAQAESDNAL